MPSVAILFLRGGSAATAVAPTEIFLFSGVLWNALFKQPSKPLFDVTTASIDGGPVRVGPLISLTPERAFSEVETPDLVFVPAGGLEPDELAADGYDIDRVIGRNAEAVQWLRRWAEDGAQIAAACSGVALVAAAGLLDGKPATAHWGLDEIYRQRFPEVDWRTEYLVTDAGDIYCGGGVNAAADLALYLVEKFCNREAATQCAKALLIEMPRTWQTAFASFPTGRAHEDAPILKAQEWLQRHYATDVRLDRLAAEVGMSPRNFARRFKEATGESPLTYIHCVRIAMAKRLLENNRATIQDVADEVGYRDLLFFRRLFKRHTGVCPNDYRRRFGDAARVGAAA